MCVSVCTFCACVCARYVVNVTVVGLFELNCVTMLRFYVAVGGEMSDSPIGSEEAPQIAGDTRVSQTCLHALESKYVYIL